MESQAVILVANAATRFQVPLPLISEINVTIEEHPREPI